MSDAPDSVTGEVAETVAPDSVDKPNPPELSGPSNADLMAKLDNLEALVTSNLPAKPGEDSGEIVEPGNGEIIRDKSPASKPWTHKRILK